jgi:glutathione S-transferase
MDRVTRLEALGAWIEAALLEQDFLDFEEPYRLGR